MASPLSPATVQYLQAQGFPHGLIQALGQLSATCPLRVWILDNSAAMQTVDAHILQPDYTQVSVTRWQELVDCVLYHADLARRMHWPTRFALLHANAGAGTSGGTTPVQQHFALHQPHTGGQTVAPDQEFQILRRELLRVVPQGPADVLTQLRLLRDYLTSIAAQLQHRQPPPRIPIVIVTQGLLTDAHGQKGPHLGQALIQMLQSFVHLPVSFVLRLVTDDEPAFEFYNALDARLPSTVSLDVLDDFYGEALEVYLRNPWLCYAIVLHRFREMGGGTALEVFDTLDERALTLSELHVFLQFLLGVALPTPQQDWVAFCAQVQYCQARERPHWNPVLKQVTPWINLPLLQSIYGPLAALPHPRSQLHHHPQQQQQQQQQPYPPQPPLRSTSQPAPQSFSAQKTTTTTAMQPQTTTQLTQALARQWSKQPPQLTHSKPIAELLATIQETFKMVPSHSYFDKFHPFSRDALLMDGRGQAVDASVLKKAVRKVRLFLHPDKLPGDLSDLQHALCRYLWDVVSEAWDAYRQQSGGTA